MRLIIAALAEESLSDYKLHVIGEGSEEEALREQASVTSVSDRVIWHGGTTDEEQIARVANACAAFVYPGAVGLSLIHAMGYGLPCIVHDRPLRHMPEISAFEKGATGVTFTKGDATSLATAVSSLLNLPETCKQMSDRCVEVTKENYTTEYMAQRFTEFVRRLEKGNERLDKAI